MFLSFSPQLVHTHFVNTHFVNTHSLITHTLSTLHTQTLCPHTHTSFHVAGVAQCHIHLRFTCLAFTVVLRGRRGTHGTGWRAWPGFVARGAAPLCVAGVALGHIHFRFTWQAWHVAGVARTQHPPSFCVAGVALMVLGGALGPDLSPGAPRHFAWQAWHLVTFTFVSRGRRGTNSHPPSFCVAGVALMVLCCALGPDLSPGAPRHFAWQAWHLVTSTFVSRGRRGTNSHPPSFCVAGVALMVLCGALGPDLSPGAPRHFAWQAWHLVTSTLVSRGRRGTNSTSTVLLRGRRGTHGTGWRAWPGFVARGAEPLCVAGVALGHIHPRFTWQAWHELNIHRRFAWQAWHSWYWVARLVRLGRPGRRGFLRGRRGTWWHSPSFHVAGVAQTRIHRRFAWQAWHSWYWVARLVRLGRPGRRGTLRGRRGTWWHSPSFHVAGVAQTRIHRRFAWQAWHSWYWVARLVRLGRPGRRGTLRGRRGTWWHSPSFHVAGVAQTRIHRRFTWQAWHKLPSTVVLRGRRGTHGTGWRAWTGLGACDAAALCVAGVAQPHIYCRFTWQAWHKLTSTVVLRGRRGTHGTFTHHFVTHHLSHTTLSHTIFRTPSFTHHLCNTPSFTPNSVTHRLWHTIFHTPLCHTPLCHTPSFTTPSSTHHLSNTPSFTPNSVTHHLWHTIFHTPLCHTPLCHAPSFTTPSSTHHLSAHHFSHTTLTLSHTIFATPAFTHHFVTHTCSETSYRITDVECISRAKTPHLSLTGEIGMILRGNQCEVNFLRPCSEESSDAAQSTMSDQIKKQLFHLTMSAVNQIAKIVQAQKLNAVVLSDSKKGKSTLRFLGWASSHSRKNGRYVTGRLQWYQCLMQASSLGWYLHGQPAPLLKKFYIFTDGSHAHPPAGGWEIKVPTMRWKWRRREMKMRWRWQWDDSYLTRTQRGERKRRGKEKTPTHET